MNIHWNFRNGFYPLFPDETRMVTCATCKNQNSINFLKDIMCKISEDLRIETLVFNGIQDTYRLLIDFLDHVMIKVFERHTRLFYFDILDFILHLISMRIIDRHISRR
ncbi:hypothetical protein NY2A_b145L [Paramecium bursaria Chlorella virus NY2A]|uniref:Uncharacterized protein b145L n=1 Tax=Paramecium bursaria Chlorella virus NY2A TaxID=46021 RepID=A7IW20_PBCVN|nr:hypothetical protein NY2A_b145L [Paramecium bursaria Chlorella virus NY2A]ABT14544.1 hypothetical protein NY2A_b145L [Paramecium bursaria Chlorella virus NY2A]